MDKSSLPPASLLHPPHNLSPSPCPAISLLCTLSDKSVCALCGH
ncbi:hypothetical protein DWUX_1219 [Desulfovibrio diazotrophicus]|nr:hypothetical protein DWUX_1219 [Desulfovibrio diazotrophicus]